MKWTAQATGYAISANVAPSRWPKIGGGDRRLMLDTGSRSVINCFQFCAVIYRGVAMCLLGVWGNGRKSRLHCAGGFKRKRI